MWELSTIKALDRRRRHESRGARALLMHAVDRAFEALADATRRQLVMRLTSGPQSAGALAEPFDISRPAVSRHLRVLREAGLVDVEPSGRQRLYRLSGGGLEQVRRWVTEVSAMWDEALRAYQRHAEARR